MKNLQLKKDWEEFKNTVLNLTHFIPETFIGIELKNYEDHPGLGIEGDYKEASITIYDNEGNLSSWKQSYNLELTDYIYGKDEYYSDSGIDEDDWEYMREEYKEFFYMLYEMVAEASILLFKQMEIKND